MSYQWPEKIVPGNTDNVLSLDYKPKSDWPPLFELTAEACEAATVAEREHIITDLEKYGLLKLPYPTIAIRFPLDAVSKQLNWTDIASKKTWTMFVRGGLSLHTIRTTQEMILPDESENGLSEEQMQQRIAERRATELRVVRPEQVLAPICVSDWKGSNWFDANQLDKEHRGAAADYCALAAEALTILLASLAARNVVKDVRYNGRQGVGANAKPVYEDAGVTYISRTVVRPPPASEMQDDPDHPPREQSKPHLRRGHPHTVVFGPGRTGRRVQWFAPTYVNYDPTFIPKPRKYLVRGGALSEHVSVGSTNTQPITEGEQNVAA